MQKVSHMILFFTADGPQPGEKKHVFFVVPKASIWGGGVFTCIFCWAPEAWVSKNQPTRGWFKQKNRHHLESPFSSSLKPPNRKTHLYVYSYNSNALEFARRNFWIIFGEDWRNLLGVKSSWSLSLFDCEHLPIFQYTIPSLKLT